VERDIPRKGGGDGGGTVFASDLRQRKRSSGGTCQLDRGYRSILIYRRKDYLKEEAGKVLTGRRSRANKKTRPAEKGSEQKEMGINYFC